MNTNFKRHRAAAIAAATTVSISAWGSMPEPSLPGPDAVTSAVSRCFDDLKKAQTPAAPDPAAQAPQSRALPSPLQSPPFNITDWAINNGQPIGENWDAPDFALQKGLFGKKLDADRIKIYGWLDAGYTASTSHHSNAPLSYDLLPNRPVLDQLILRVERQPDTVQTAHPDWGFRVTGLYGIDYRYTAADGWFFDQLQKHNMLYGFDPVECNVQYYVPNIYEGTVFQVGRYISPVDIEAQLAPENYLYSHSIMFTVDPYTYTGANAQIRLSKYYTLMLGVHAGDDKAPWEKSAELNAEVLLGWQSHTNGDSLWGGIDSIGGGKYQAGHDDEQISSIVWGHKISNQWHMQNEMYYMWERNAPMGGTEIDGATEPYAGGGGPGPIINGTSHANGFVSYVECALDSKSYLTIRNDYLNDPQGWRTGFQNAYFSWTLGYSHFFTPTIQFRPELRYDMATMQGAYDNGARKTQWTLGADIIYRF